MYKDEETFNAFVAWCKTKPADEEYDFGANRNCAYARFLKETDRCARPSVSVGDWRDRDQINGPSIYHKIDGRLAYNDDEPLQAGTFGGILQRLKENGHV